MGIMGRLVAGAAQGAGQIVGKYIDEEIANNRSTFLADLEQKNFERKDQYQNSDAVVGRNRENKVADETAIGTARNAVDLAGRRAQATDTELRAGEVARAGDLAGITARASATAAAETTKKYGNDPAYLGAMRKEAQAKHIDSAASTATALESQFRLGVMKKESTLRDDLMKAMESGDKAGEEKVRDKLRALDPKNEGKVAEFYKVAEQAARAMAPAQKLLADSMTSPEAKADAEQTVREQRALMGAAAKRAGVDLAEASKVPEASAHAQAKDAIKAGASTEAVNKMLADKGYRPLPAAEKKPASIMDAMKAKLQPAADVEQPPDYLNDAGKQQWLADAPKRAAEKAARKLRTGESLRRSAGQGYLAEGD